MLFCAQVYDCGVQVLNGSVNRLVHKYVFSLSEECHSQTASLIYESALLRECTLELSNNFIFSRTEQTIECELLVHVES